MYQNDMKQLGTSFMKYSHFDPHSKLACFLYLVNMQECLKTYTSTVYFDSIV